MLIPTEVYGSATLANPDTSYWCQTAAHFYINPPGISAAQACVWGTNNQDVGNWSPYVAGTNTDNSGQTFIKLGWNPIYLEPTTPFRNQMPNWGVRIECPDGKCNGLPCEINPQENSVNQMSGSSSNGAGGGAFCVVTVPKGSTANFVVFGGSGNWGDKGGQFYGQSSTQSSASSASTTTTVSSTASSTSSSSTTTWAVSDNSTSSTTSYKSETTRTPNRNLFGESVPASEPTATLTSPVEAPSSEKTTSSPSVMPAAATGSAAHQQWSIAGFAVALLAAVTLL